MAVKNIKECYSADPETGQVTIYKVDCNTNEIIEVQESKFKEYEDHAHINYDFMINFIGERKYKNNTFRLLFFFIGTVGYNNKIKPFTIKEIAQRLELTPKTVSKHLNILENDGVIFKEDKHYFFYHGYVMSPDMFETYTYED